MGVIVIRNNIIRNNIIRNCYPFGSPAEANMRLRGVEGRWPGGSGGLEGLEGLEGWRGSCRSPFEVLQRSIRVPLGSHVGS